MKAFSLFLLTLPLGLYSQMTYVPDDNFEQVFINGGLDFGALNDSVSTIAISNITHLNLQAKNIFDLTGIEDFSSLAHLDCSINNIDSLDLSLNLNLVTLDCSLNALKEILLSPGSALQSVKCSANILTELDVSTLDSLTYLSCWGNNFANINLTNNIQLDYLDFSSNNLTSLNLIENNKIENVYCSNNLLSELIINNGQGNLNLIDANNNPDLYCINVSGIISDVTIDPQSYLSSNCDDSAYTSIPDDNFELALNNLGLDNGILDRRVLTAYIDTVKALYVIQEIIFDLTGIEAFSALEKLYCSGNNLFELDVSENKQLETLWCDNNNIKELNLNQNTNLNTLWCHNNDLKTLKLKNGNNSAFETDTNIGQLQIISFRAENNPRLECIEVDNPQWSKENWINKDDNSRFVLSELDCLGVLSLEEKNANESIILNNPINESLNISVQAELSFIINNINGKEITRGKLNKGENSISLSKFSAGIYFITFRESKSLTTKKIIKL